MIGNDMVRISRFISMTPILFSFILLPLSHKKKPPGKMAVSDRVQEMGLPSVYPRIMITQAVERGKPSLSFIGIAIMPLSDKRHLHALAARLPSSKKALAEAPQII